MKKLIACLFVCGAAAFAADKPAEKGADKAGDKAAAKPAEAGAMQMDMTKVGPMSRKVTKEDKKGIDALYAAVEAGMAKGDLDSWVDNVDFPVVMATDDSKGVESHQEMTKEKFIETMKPFMHPHPADMKVTHKHVARFLSDTLAMVDEDTSMSQGKMKGAWKSESMVVNKDGKWKFKMMVEAGWGDMSKAHEQPKAAGNAGAK